MFGQVSLVKRSAKPAETSYIVMSPKYKPVTESILYLIFFMYVAITHCSIYSGEEKNVQFMILTHLRPWNKVKVIKPGMNWQIKQSYNLANLKDLPQTVSTKKPISSVCVCLNQKARQVSPLNMCKSEK